MAETWANYAGYPRTCHRCGEKVSLKKGAFFRSLVGKGGKLVEQTSECAVCLHGEVRQDPHLVRPDGEHSPRCLCSECTKARIGKAATL